MPNPNPTPTPEFLATMGKGTDDGHPIAKDPIPVKFGEDVDYVLRYTLMGSRSAYIRAAVRAKMIADGLISP